MQTIRKILSSLCLSMLLLAPGARADDTDIYLGTNSPAGSEPLIMFSIDYRANLTSTVCSDVTAASCTGAAYFRSVGLSADLPASGKLTLFDVIRLSLKHVLKDIRGVRIGLMMSHNQDGNCVGNQGTSPANNQRCSNGGAILMGFQTLDATDSNGARAGFNRRLQALHRLKPESNSPDHPYQGRELFFEFYRYLTGGGVYNAYNGWLDFESGNTKNTNTNMLCGSSDPVLSAACYDSAIISGNSYTSPLNSACAKIYTINFMFQVSQQDADSDAAITSASGGMTGINLSGNNADLRTVLAYLRDRDLAPSIPGRQSVESFFLVPANQINNTTNGYAAAGGTNNAIPLASDPAELVAALQSILRQIVSTSATFVSASVPVNVFNRSTVVDNVYIALFQAETTPRWNGNLKKLRLRERALTDGSKVAELYDALNANAVSTDGRINFDALTFWTDGSLLTDSDAEKNIIAGRDGRHITRGGAGQKIPGFRSGGPGLTNSATGARQLFYDGAAGSNLLALNADNTTATALRGALGAADDAEALGLLRFARGLNDDGTTRNWILGDPLHSRPLPINFGASVSGYSESNPAIFIAMGSNDGYMRLFRNTTAAGAESGEEVWAFMPKAVMGVQKRLKSNLSSTSHPYAVDGSPVAFQDTANGKTYLYFGLRRGGRAYYALDISDPTATPKLQWVINNATSGFSELGLTFSTPQLGSVLVDGTATPALFFGGGYDTNKDYKNPNGADSQGRAIYVVNARTGALIWHATAGSNTGSHGSTRYTHIDLKDSIPSDVTIADTDGDGHIDRLVVGDTGGNVWRADFAGARSAWKLTRLATLGYHGLETFDRLHDRRFFHAPDIVQSRDSTGAFDAVIIGSGDRADPLDSQGRVKNYLFMIKDRNITPGFGADSSVTLTSLTDITTETCLIRNTCTTAPDLTNGWRLELTDTGEKSLASPVTFGNVVYFTTYIPAGGSTETATCGPKEGNGAMYAVTLDRGSAAFNYNQSDDIAGDDSGLANSAADRRYNLASSGIPSQVVFIPFGSQGLSFIRPDLSVGKPPISNRFRTFWRRHQ